MVAQPADNSYQDPLDYRCVDFQVLSFYYRVVGVALIVLGPVRSQISSQSYLTRFIEAREGRLVGPKYFLKKATASEGGKG